jgi:hypothetical protein
VLHVREAWEGERTWNPVVLPGNSVRGRVVDPDGNGVEAAVVAGGQNWTPTNPDGTFWLDNVFEGPLALEVAHHAWRTLHVAGIPTNGEGVTLRFERPLPRVTLRVTGGDGAPAPLVAIDWVWGVGGGPGRFAPESRFWHDAKGVFLVTVPDGATGATVSDAAGGTTTLAGEDLVDGADRTVVLAAPPLEPR